MSRPTVPDDVVRQFWRDVNGPHAQINGPVLAFAAKVAAWASLQPVRAEEPTKKHPHTHDGKDKNRCVICGDGPWGIHRFQKDEPHDSSTCPCDRCAGIRSGCPAPVRAEEPTARIDELAMWVLDGKKLPGSTVVSVGYWTADPSAMLGERFDAVVRTTLGDLRKQFAAALPPVQEPPKPEGPGATRSHRFDCDECQVRGVVVDEDGCCKGCGHEARMVASPSQGVRLDDLKALVETLRTKEIDRLRSTGVNADYSESARRANAYLKALADLSDAMEALEGANNGKA